MTYTFNEQSAQATYNDQTGAVYRHYDHQWDRLVYKREPREKPLFDCPTVFFHIDFIRKPSFGWTVDYDGADCQSLRERGHIPHASGCFEGVLLKHPETGRIWQLTGQRDHDNDELAYEGRWPD